MVGQISATYCSVTTHCLRSVAVDESLPHCTPQEQRSASSPLRNLGYSADLQNSLALVHHLGTTAVLQTLDTLSACAYFGDHCYVTDIEQRSASARFGSHCCIGDFMNSFLLVPHLEITHLKYWKSKRCTLSLLTSQKHRVCPCSDVWWWNLQKRNKWNAARTTCQHLCCVGVHIIEL